MIPGAQLWQMYHHHDKMLKYSLVPVPILATGTVPDAILEPFKLVKDAPEPLNVVALKVPVTYKD